MTVASTQGGGGSQVQRAPSSTLADVVEQILDKGLVIDAFVRVSLVGIEIITVDARVVVAGVDTYLRFAEATNRLDLDEKGGKDLTELTEGMTQRTVEGKAKGMIDAAKDKFDEFRGSDEQEKEPVRRRESGGRKREQR
ncbi:Gas vesicle protein [Saccharopolyspora antimicrobica]|uniref:Gas vesicle protein A n=1 Tax=Saccharopolyspora antimicrobica TaxID=455193 RepID=A0A1I5KXJ0_9PSEU|nr:gas vesicle protein GvpJ [Saccharopolyspora antimicrobica]RKT89096.1 gas vesicle protein GvpA/GvpJ/GvpM family [Saccharopolyspora antimicrobica]SFO89622.1 Gas vesicle protein [Saccharopolyspora antimicrobica]